MSDDEDPFAELAKDPYAPRPKRPWFGRKPYGYGFGPRTWQGWLVVGVLIVFAILMASAGNGNGGLVLLGVAPLVLVPLAITWFQRR